MFVFTRSIETARFKALAGMPIPVKFNSVHARRYLRSKYGDDLIMEIDYSNPEEFLKVIGADSDEMLRENFIKLKMLADEQASTITDMKRDNERLKKELRRATKEKAQ